MEWIVTGPTYTSSQNASKFAYIQISIYNLVMKNGCLHKYHNLSNSSSALKLAFLNTVATVL